MKRREKARAFEISLEIQSFLSLVYENKCHGATSEKATGTEKQLSMLYFSHVIPRRLRVVFS